MSTFTERLALSMPGAGDTNWDGEINGALATLDELSSFDNVFYVAPNFTAANLGNSGATDRRHFDTIQGALDVINAASDNPYTMIKLAPYVWSETLDIQRSVHITGPAPVQYQSQGGQTLIEGDGSLNPTVTVEPPTNTTIYVKFSNLAMDNQYSTDNAVEQDAYLLNAEAQITAPSYPSCIDFQDCSLRMQTWGPHNKWAYGVKVEGQYRVRTFNVRASGLSYGGGHGDGYIKNLFGIFGHLATSSTAEAQFERSIFHNSITYHADCCIINFARFLGWWYNCGCTMTRTDAAVAGIGDNCAGIDSDAAVIAYNNKFSISIHGE